MNKTCNFEIFHFIRYFFYQLAVDISTCMMTKAQERVKQLVDKRISFISWIIHDLNGNSELTVNDSSVDAVISTLMIEHIVSLNRFFKTVYRILKKNNDSWAFITTMHPDMYRAGSQAGFINDQATGDKLCGVSFDYSIKDVIEAATKSYLVLIKYAEKKVEDEKHAEKLGPRATKWIGVNIYASFLFKIQDSRI